MEENEDLSTTTNAPTAPDSNGLGADGPATNDPAKHAQTPWWSRWLFPLRCVFPGVAPDPDATSLKTAVMKAASDGQDMELAAKTLDEAMKAQPNDPELPTGVAATIRSELHYGPFRKAFSESAWPYLLMVYELGALTGWLYLLGILGRNCHNIVVFLSQGQWNLPDLLVASTVAGSIGAISLALYGIYIHTKYRSMDHGFVIWYVIRPISGGLMGAFVGLISRIVLTGISAHGMTANIVVLCITFLAGSNEKFAAQMIDRFTSQILGDKPPSSKAPAAGRKGPGV